MAHKKNSHFVESKLMSEIRLKQKSTLYRMLLKYQSEGLKMVSLTIPKSSLEYSTSFLCNLEGFANRYIAESHIRARFIT